MASRARIRIEVRPDNFADQISLFSFHATVVAPAMLFWLEASSGRIHPQTMVNLAELFHVTLFRMDDSKRIGVMELSVDREDGKFDYQVVFDFSQQPEFSPQIVREQVETSLQKYHEHESARSI